MFSKLHHRRGGCRTKLHGRAPVPLDLGPQLPDLAPGSPHGRESEEQGARCREVEPEEQGSAARREEQVAGCWRS